MNKSTGPWLYAGLASSLPSIEPDDNQTGKTRIRSGTAEDGFSELPPPCRILHSKEQDDALNEVTRDEAQTTIGLQPQVLVFRYRGKIHAMDHACPHQTYPLSRGTIYDIEDFGVVLSAGITCPKHGWAFDLFTGESDRGRYKLNLWEVDVRDGEDGQEIWVRRRERKRIG
ncbi:hypothetical protein DOTSEDRAFT_62263 [Dothistroma septosporum NZE10]|uniref:Rieske domain-containing protein n=1 Tax=Dothistroma septosporum (strain NZE10 / CBS 128990) TaxID=675120 RepID=N1PS94_DOTSN|nr:hypothetical protein DOTSEDRAFT_62263 [Dothistroma septosporum NZE10]